MLTLLKNLLGIGPKVDLNVLMTSGAIVVDVRTPSEYKDGHVEGSINIPLQTLNTNLNK